MVYVFLADGFEEIEALGMVDILRRCEIDVKTVSITEELTVNGTHNISVNADITLSQVILSDAEALVLPGGLPGADNLENHKTVTDYIKTANKEGKILASICAAPKVFGILGLLSGVKATCYPGFEAKLVGAHVKRAKVVRDKNIITSRGAGTTHLFALKIAEALGKKTQAQRVIRAMQY